MGGGCTASPVVGGWAVPYVGVLFRPVGDEPFSWFLTYRPPPGAWEYHRPHCCTPLSITTVRTAVLLPCYYLVALGLTEDDTFTTVGTAALPYCLVIILFL